MSICMKVTDWGSLEVVNTSIESCTEFVLVSSSHFKNNTNQFDPVVYDLGFEGVIKMFIAGIAIGAIIGMITKLRR